MPTYTTLQPTTAINNSINAEQQTKEEAEEMIDKVAPTDALVLITGSNGTGKEMVAHWLHEKSERSNGPMIEVNCAAIPDNLLESELFGHEKGSFTGASNKKIGRFEQANGATLFLDEIGDMQPLLQAKMLRVLQEKVIQRVGGTAEIPVDVRVIAATHRNLEQMVDDGAFRADLLYRLNGTTLKLPPLRDRLGDVSVLTNHFLSRFGLELGVGNPRITPEALSFLARQPWPGNIRQLQNVLRQAILKRRDLAIGAADLRPLILSDSPIIGSDTSLGKLATSILSKASKGELDHGAYREMIALAEETIITQTLQQTNGNQSQAADLLGITRYTLREKIKSLAISL